MAAIFAVLALLLLRVSSLVLAHEFEKDRFVQPTGIENIDTDLALASAALIGGRQPWMISAAGSIGCSSFSHGQANLHFWLPGYGRIESPIRQFSNSHPLVRILLARAPPFPRHSRICRTA